MALEWCPVFNSHSAGNPLIVIPVIGAVPEIELAFVPGANVARLVRTRGEFAIPVVVEDHWPVA